MKNVGFIYFLGACFLLGIGLLTGGVGTAVGTYCGVLWGVAVAVVIGWGLGWILHVGRYKDRRLSGTLNAGAGVCAVFAGTWTSGNHGLMWGIIVGCVTGLVGGLMVPKLIDYRWRKDEQRSARSGDGARCGPRGF